MNTNRNQYLLVMVTALVVVAGLLLVPLLDQQDANASKVNEKLQKAQEKIQNSLKSAQEKINSKLCGERHCSIRG